MHVCYLPQQPGDLPTENQQNIGATRGGELTKIAVDRICNTRVEYADAHECSQNYFEFACLHGCTGAPSQQQHQRVLQWGFCVLGFYGL